MPPLKLVGVPPQFDVQTNSQYDVVPQSYINYLLSLNLAMPQVTTQINAALTPFATTSYANTQMADLATSSYVTTQEANYLQAATLGQPSGPIALSSLTNQVIPGIINAASTQQWPSPYWSPTGYNTTPIVATTTPEQLYSIAVPNPGYPYVLLCTGLVDTQVATNSGAYAQVFVRQGSISGPVVAFGYGTPESYEGAAPGQYTSQLVVEGTNLAPAWTTISSWAAVNNQVFTSSGFGNFLQVMQTLSAATLTVSIPFSGANDTGATTAVRIINSSNTVLATGSVITGESGIATATWSGSVTEGQLYAVQIIETVGGGTPVYASIASGTFTLTPMSVLNASTVNILPVPFSYQYPLNTNTTLYVMLSSSDNATQVTATNSFPALSVTPIPWVAPTAPPTAFDAVGAGHAGESSTWSWAHDLGEDADVILVFGEFAVYGDAAASPIYGSGAKNQAPPLIGYNYSYSDNITSPPVTATINGQNITPLGWVVNYDEVGQEFYLLVAWGRVGPPTGSTTIEVVAETGTYGVANSVSYSSVASLDSFVYGEGISSNTSLLVGGQSGEMAVMAFSGGGVSGDFTGFNQTSRYSYGGADGAYALLVGDAPGSSLGQAPFTAVAPTGTTGWAGVGITLSPIGLPTVVYDASGPGYTGSTTVSEVGGSWYHTATAGAAVVVATGVGINGTYYPSCTRQVTYGGASMTSLGIVNVDNDPYGWVELFGIIGVPGGQKEIIWEVSGTAVSFYTAAANSVSYLNVGSFGSPVINTGAGTALTSGTITTGLNQVIVQAFVSEYGAAPGVSYSSYNQELRSIQTAYNTSIGWGTAFEMGDALGGVINFQATSSESSPYGSIAIPLIIA